MSATYTQHLVITRQFREHKLVDTSVEIFENGGDAHQEMSRQVGKIAVTESSGAAFGTVDGVRGGHVVEVTHVLENGEHGVLIHGAEYDYKVLIQRVR